MFRDELQADIAQKMKLPGASPLPREVLGVLPAAQHPRENRGRGAAGQDFTDKVPDPTEAQVAALFEKHKDDFEQAFDGEFKPGFRQPPEGETALPRCSVTPRSKTRCWPAGPVTDKEIEEYYETQQRHRHRGCRNADMLRRDDDAARSIPNSLPKGRDRSPTDELDPTTSRGEPNGNDPKRPGQKSPKKSDEVRPNSRRRVEVRRSGKDAADSEKTASAAAADDDDQRRRKSRPDKADGQQGRRPRTKLTRKDEPTAGRNGARTAKQKPSRRKRPTVNPEEARSSENQVQTARRRPSRVIRESIIQNERCKVDERQNGQGQRGHAATWGSNSRLPPKIKLTDPNPEQLERSGASIGRGAPQDRRQLGMKFGKTDLVSSSN